MVGGEGADDLRRDVQAWRTRQRETTVQVFATHGVLHQTDKESTESRVTVLNVR